MDAETEVMPRERLAITMETSLRERVDELAKSERRGRSNTIEILLDEALAAREAAATA